MECFGDAIESKNSHDTEARSRAHYHPVRIQDGRCNWPFKQMLDTILLVAYAIFTIGIPIAKIACDRDLSTNRYPQHKS